MFTNKKTQRPDAAPRTLPAPALERLEDRTLLSGNVIGVVAAGTLTLTGDGGDNTFTVDQAGLSAQQFRLTPDGTTQINNSGLGVPVIFNVVNRDVKMNLGDGNDTVTFTSAALPGNLVVNGGDGDNAVNLDASTVARRVKITNGVGNDIFRLVNASRVDNSVAINNGDGDSATLLDNSIILWDLKVIAADGADTLDIVNVSLVNRYVRTFFDEGGSTTTVDNSGITGRLFVAADPGGTDVVNVLNGSTLSKGANLYSAGSLVFTADDSRFDDNVVARGDAGLTASLLNGSYFAFRLALSGGSTAASNIILNNITANGAFSIRTDGGSDTVTIDDSTFNKTASVRLGGGDDTLAIEQTGAGPGPVTTFAGRFTFLGDGGDDTVSLGVPASAGNQVVFDAKSLFDGGGGLDTHALPENAVYNGPNKFVNF
ncbi:MAG: hypothetical protein NTV86_05855 [Planctomycetota bacterium]|nr:hypothetical protein [Planctomycetota bacterium]